jgi:hypothetical protein
MVAIAEGAAPGCAGAGRCAIDAALLPHWLGRRWPSWLLSQGGSTPRWPPAWPSPPAGADAGWLTWYTTFHLARTDAAQPLPFAFGGEADPVDYARADGRRRRAGC